MRYLIKAAFFCLVLSLTPCLLGAEVYESDQTPWSGYWWSYNNGGMATGIGYNGYPAPLEKYELLVNGFAQGESVEWYLENYYDPEAPDWYGLCANWALASVYEPAPILPSVVDNLHFNVGDKKALLTLAHTDDLQETAPGSDPATFHYWLLHYIRDQGLAFVADLSPGTEIWSYPIFKYDMRKANHSAGTSVTVTIYYVDDMVDPDYIGSQIQSATYTYILEEDGQGNIIDAEWTGESVSDHPELLRFPLVPGSDSPYLDYDQVQQIVYSTDDALEEEQALQPNTYRTVLADPDQFSLDLEPGQFFSLRVTTEGVYGNEFNCTLTDGSGLFVSNSTISKGSPAEFRGTAKEPPYTLTCNMQDYSLPASYSLVYDREHVYSQQVPFMPRSSSVWSGFALTNPSNATVRDITLTTYDGFGDPLHTVLGPLDLAPREKLVLTLEELGIRPHERLQSKGLLLMAEDRVNLLNLFGGIRNNSGMSCLVQGQTRSNHLAIADIVSSGDFLTSMRGAVLNESLEDNQTQATVYYEDGRRHFAYESDLRSRERLDVQPGSPPFFSLPDNGWIEWKSSRPIAGFQSINSSYFNEQEAWFALPVDSREKYVLHIPQPHKWTTTLKLINAENATNTLTIHPLNLGPDDSLDRNYTLEPKEKLEIDLGALAASGDYGSRFLSLLKVSGSGDFAGYYQYGTGADPAAYPLFPATALDRELVVPHVASPVSWWNGVVLGNPAQTAAEVKIKAYDLAGKRIDPLEPGLSIPAGEYRIFLLRDLFGRAAMQDMAFVVFTSSSSRLCGLYLYGRGVDMLAGSNM
ncbi:MAG: hypothetical protein K9J81_11785 [Desulfohalobiaceae bacterium]|nr:hypothetical protein [Desulfohalobiaceae bacterium]